MKSKKCLSLHRVGAFLVGLALASISHAAVIQGTGTPSNTQLGLTDAVAFTMTETGPGHIVVVPYFSAQNGQMSVLHLVNTDVNNGKVIKVRYRGAGNGDTLLDFLVLLSPGDVWTAAVVAGQDGLAQLITADQSCTYPRIQNLSPVSFSTARLNPAWGDAVKANNTREGSIEAIVVADVSSSATYGTPRGGHSALYTAIRGFFDPPPCTSSVLDASLLTDLSSEAIAAGLGFATPSGGVAGSWYIIDVAGSTTFSGAATAFRAVNPSGKNARGNFVLFPQSSALVSQPERYTADPLLVSAGLAGRVKDASGNLSNLTTAAVLNAQFTDLPDLSTPYYLPASAFNARVTAGDLSKLMEVTEAATQFSTETSISAKTDLVIAMPTKRYSVAVDYSRSMATYEVPHPALVFSVVPPAASNNQYFYTAYSRYENTILGRALYNTTFEQPCTYYRRDMLGGNPHVDQTIFDRVGRHIIAGAVFMPVEINRRLCGSVNVHSLYSSQPSSALSSSVTVDHASSVYLNGWRNINPVDAKTGLGIPIIGATFIKLTNPLAQPGILGNYGIAWPFMRIK